jgi:hypothetical protein
MLVSLVGSSLPKLKAPIPKVKGKPKSPDMNISEPLPDHTLVAKSVVSQASVVRFGDKPADKEYVIVELDTKDWVFHQTTAVASCEMEDGFYIPANMVKFVNSNGNSFLNEHLEKYYTSFIGAHNFYEHIQDPKKSYGFLGGAVLRPITQEDGSTVNYVDVLVCTNKNVVPNKSVVNRVEAGKLTTLSMGCFSTGYRCSKCGHMFVESSEKCDCIRRSLGRNYLSPKGELSKVSAIVYPYVGDQEDGAGINFVELSWVEDPAFVGATSSYRLDFDQNDKVYLKIPMSSYKRDDGFDAINHWSALNQLKVIL